MANWVVKGLIGWFQDIFRWRSGDFNTGFRFTRHTWHVERKGTIATRSLYCCSSRLFCKLLTMSDAKSTPSNASLTQTLDELRTAIQNQLPQSSLEIMNRATETLIRDGLAEKSLQVAIACLILVCLIFTMILSRYRHCGHGPCDHFILSG